MSETNVENELQSIMAHLPPSLRQKVGILAETIDALKAENEKLRADRARPEGAVSETADYILGFNKGYEEALENEAAMRVEITTPHDCNCCAAIHDAEAIKPGFYDLIPADRGENDG